MTTSDASDSNRPLLDELRTRVQQDPDAAVVELQKRLAGGVGVDPALRVDLRILLVEVHQQLGHWEQAYTAAGELDMLLRIAAVPDQARAIRAVGVSADMAVCSGHSAAVEAATAYLRQLVGESPDVDLGAYAAGAGLLAVAVYHRLSCRTGLHDLATIRAKFTAEQPMAQALDLAIAAGESACQGAANVTPVPDFLPPLPGAVLSPDSALPRRSWLAHRIRLHAATHTCESSGR